MPVIRDDDVAVQKVRSWLRECAPAQPAATEAADGSPGPASTDRLTKELLDAWMTRQYDLGRAGAKEASCKVRAKVGEAPGATAEGIGQYRWNGESGSLTWDNAELGAGLALQGWGARKIDMWFRADRRVDLDGARLTATRAADGGIVVRDGTFRPPDAPGEALKEIRFGADGTLASTLTAVRGELGGVADATLTFRYENVDGLCALGGWTMELEVEATPIARARSPQLR
jgi:hypothetical protein